MFVNESFLIEKSFPSSGCFSTQWAASFILVVVVKEQHGHLTVPERIGNPMGTFNYSSLTSVVLCSSILRCFAMFALFGDSFLSEERVRGLEI